MLGSKQLQGTKAPTDVISYGGPPAPAVQGRDIEGTSTGSAAAAEPGDSGELVDILSSAAGDMLETAPKEGGAARRSTPPPVVGAEPAIGEKAGSGGAPSSEGPPTGSASVAKSDAEPSILELLANPAPAEELSGVPAPSSIVESGRGEPLQATDATPLAVPVDERAALVETLLAKSGEEVARELAMTLESPVEATAKEPIPETPLEPMRVLPPVALPVDMPPLPQGIAKEQVLPPAEDPSAPVAGGNAEEAIDIEADELPSIPPAEPAALTLEAEAFEREQQQQGAAEGAADGADGSVPALESGTMEGLGPSPRQPLASPEEEDASGDAVAGEVEDEDIDIEDVDEEEEAKIKEAMRVGLGSEEAVEPYAGTYAANGGATVEVEGDAGQDLVADEKLRAPRPRNKRKLADDGSFPPGVVRRTRQRTARPAHKLKRRIVPGGGELPYLHVEAPEDEEEVAGEPPAAAAKLRRAKMASTTPGSPTEGVSRNSKVKKPEESFVRFSIKSFAVPELIVALPETASVSALKKAVMEAAMTLLGGGLRVRVLLQGKRMSDEATSLAQAGISRAALAGKTSDALAFMLEPSPLVMSPGDVDNDPLLVLSQAAVLPSPSVELTDAGPVYGAAGRVRAAGGRLKGRAVKGAEMAPPPYQPPEPQVNIYGEPIGKARVGARAAKPGSPAVPSPHTTRVAAAQALAAIRSQAQEQAKEEPLTAGSGAIVLHQSAYEQGQSLALVHHKRAGGMQLLNMEGRRRIRRPFTVAEVGALVDAVEQLGTGRCAAALTSAWWRDVKLRAFSQAKHRTYVDLKDKWRALVRTAQIPPHQRRGEPIPQELLDRVVRAHAYWTEQLQLEMMEDER